MRGLSGLIRTHWQHTPREEPGGDGGGGGVVGAKGLLGLVSQPEALVWVLGSRADGVGCSLANCYQVCVPSLGSGAFIDGKSHCGVFRSIISAVALNRNPWVWLESEQEAGTRGWNPPTPVSRAHTATTYLSAPGPIMAGLMRELVPGRKGQAKGKGVRKHAQGFHFLDVWGFLFCPWWGGWDGILVWPARFGGD